MPKGKTYSAEFRENAVRLSYSPGKTVAQVARELEISAYTLHGWRRKALDAARINDAKEGSAEEQMRRLARENEMLREEAAILKKAIAYFAQPPKK